MPSNGIKESAPYIERLQNNGIQPVILYGSRGASAYLGDFKAFSDFDLLVPDEWLGVRWDELVGIMGKMGFKLVNLREHEFTNDVNTDIAFAKQSILERDGIIEAGGMQASLVGITVGSSAITTLSAKAFKRAYEFSLKDGYRQDARRKKDAEIIRLLDEYIKDANEASSI